MMYTRYTHLWLRVIESYLFSICLLSIATYVYSDPLVFYSLCCFTCSISYSMRSSLHNSLVISLDSSASPITKFTISFWHSLPEYRIMYVMEYRGIDGLSEPRPANSVVFLILLALIRLCFKNLLSELYISGINTVSYTHLTLPTIYSV